MLGLGGRPPTVAEQTASLEADITTTRASQKQAQLLDKNGDPDYSSRKPSTRNFTP